jgi:hypothetical protein
MKDTDLPLPEGFAELAPFLDWNLDTADQRQDKRRRSTSEELQLFYDAVVPRMDEILALLDTSAPGELPPAHRLLFNLACSLAEIAPNVELYKCSPGVPYSFEESRMIAGHGNQATWRGLTPMASN